MTGSNSEDTLSVQRVYIGNVQHNVSIPNILARAQEVKSCISRSHFSDDDLVFVIDELTDGINRVQRFLPWSLLSAQEQDYLQRLAKQCYLYLLEVKRCFSHGTPNRDRVLRLRTDLLASIAGMDMYCCDYKRPDPDDVGYKTLENYRVMDAAVPLDFEGVNSILEWLTPASTAAKYADSIRTHEDGTLTWFLESVKFEVWCSRTQRTLFCPGPPGAGKTILTAAVVKHLRQKYGNEAGFAIAYVYPPDNVQEGQAAEEMLASVLKQLVQCKRSVPKDVQILYAYHRVRNSRLALEELVMALDLTLRDNSKSFVLVDALDERISHADRESFLSTLFYLQSKRNVNIFATSRFDGNIQAQLEERGCFTIPIYASESDIRCYVRRRLSLTPHLAQHAELCGQIETAVVGSADRMFVLAKALVERFLDKVTRKEIQDEIGRIQENCLNVDWFHDASMTRINSQSAGLRDLAVKILAWLMLVPRCLTVTELQKAIAVETEGVDGDPTKCCNIRTMLSVCSGLVEADGESSTVSFAHPTIRCYLKRSGDRLFPGLEHYIARTCLRYLASHPTDGLFLDAAYGLCDYAIGTGSCCCAPKKASNGQYKIAPFLRLEDARNPAGRAWKAILPIHFAANFGVSEMFPIFFEKGLALDQPDRDGSTPLLRAAERGHEGFILGLLESGQVNCDYKDAFNQSALSHAAAHGLVKVVRMLMERGAEVDSKDTDGRTALSYAAAGNHVAVVSLLCAAGANPELEDSTGTSPLEHARRAGSREVAQVLSRNLNNLL